MLLKSITTSLLLLFNLLLFNLVTIAAELESFSEVEDSVTIYNWSDYIPEGVIEDFTKETGIKVDYATFDNNEIMYTKLRLLKGRGYDVIVPSTYLVARMRDEGLLRPIDHALLKNLKHLDPTLLNKKYDPNNNYSIPYLWGSTGIAIKVEQGQPVNVSSWRDLWHRRWRGRLFLLDDMREAFHMSFKIEGRSTNTTDPDAIKQAYQRLRRLMPNVEALNVDPVVEFRRDEIDIGIVWSGEAALAQEENPNIQYIYPLEGANFWIDSFVIPARAINVENAHRFIDYMLRPEIAVRCVQELGYATPNATAKELLDESIRNNPIIFPPQQVLDNAEFQQDIGNKASNLISLYWGILKTVR